MTYLDRLGADLNGLASPLIVSLLIYPVALFNMILILIFSKKLFKQISSFLL